ncbi:putative uncharacterized protein DDB_G0282499 [Achroia grisella]|uniref:putative uncharacterized protein DDB_G0282499 n=1 Tax=Achroia grisella TaxID=688607 RepID=UPI0027D25F19|nr:putative uncharacterized protein DDB_G0282499 [Achroia grisella]
MFNIVYRVCLVIIVLFNYKSHSIEINRKYAEDQYTQDSHILEPIEYDFEIKDNSVNLNKNEENHLHYTATPTYESKYEESSIISVLRSSKKEDEDTLIRKQRVTREIKAGNSQLYPQLYPGSTPSYNQNIQYYNAQHNVSGNPYGSINYPGYTTPAYITDNRSKRPQYPYNTQPSNGPYNNFNISSTKPGLALNSYNYTSHRPYSVYNNISSGYPSHSQTPNANYYNKQPNYSSYNQNPRPYYNSTTYGQYPSNSYNPTGYPNRPQVPHKNSNYSNPGYPSYTQGLRPSNNVTSYGHSPSYGNTNSYNNTPSFVNSPPNYPFRSQVPYYNNSGTSYPSYIQNSRTTYNVTQNGQYPISHTPHSGYPSTSNNTWNYNYPRSNLTNQRPYNDRYHQSSGNSFQNYPQNQGQNSFGSNPYQFNQTSNYAYPYNTNPDQNFFYPTKRNNGTYDPKNNDPSNLSHYY